MDSTNERTPLKASSGLATAENNARNNRKITGNLPTKIYFASAIMLLVAITAIVIEPRLNEDSIMSIYPMEGKRSHKKCMSNPRYSKETLKTAYEMPFAALFGDTRGEKKFEASSVTNVNGTFYAICDNSWSISKFASSLTAFSEQNTMIGDPNREEEDSGYEAIFHHNDIFYVIRESVKHTNDTEGESCYHAIIEELVINPDGSDYEIKDQCRCEYEFEGDSKGFEGGFGMEGVDGNFYVFGLCEGNLCSEEFKFDKGNGKVILMKKNVTKCLWETVKTIDIPSTANFRDYSDISIRPNGKVAITTQEDSALWLGQMLGVKDGKIDPEIVSFDNNVHEIYYFPKADTCDTVYCNVEGITFINDEMLMAVSDKMKSKGKQPFQCFEKDQSIHAFVLP